MEEKKCFKCKSVKPLYEFYKHPMMPDGRVNKCKSCNKKDNIKNRNDKIEYYREYDRERSLLPHRVELRKEQYSVNKHTEKYKENHYKSNKKYLKNNPEKRKATRAVQYAISSGKLKKMPCIICGDEKAEAHHTDYAYPLNIIWLCEKHHKEEHVRTGSFRKILNNP